LSFFALKQNASSGQAVCFCFAGGDQRQLMQLQQMTRRNTPPQKKRRTANAKNMSMICSIFVYVIVNCSCFCKSVESKLDNERDSSWTMAQPNQSPTSAEGKSGRTLIIKELPVEVCKDENLCGEIQKVTGAVTCKWTKGGHLELGFKTHQQQRAKQRCFTSALATVCQHIH